MKLTVDALRRNVLNRNLKLALVVVLFVAVIFAIFMQYYISESLRKDIRMLDESFKSLLEYFCKALEAQSVEYIKFVESEIEFVATLVKNVPELETLREIKNFYISNLPPALNNVDVILLDRNGKAVMATGLVGELDLTKMKFNLEQKSGFFFVPSTRYLTFFYTHQLNGNYITLILYLRPELYEALFRSFTMRTSNYLRNITVYVDSENKLGFSSRSPDNILASSKKFPVISRSIVGATYYNRYRLMSPFLDDSYIYLKVNLNYASFFNFLFVGIIVFVITVIVSTVFSVNSTVEPFVKDITRIETAVKEMGNTGILPPQADFEITEINDIYTALASLVQELSASMEELEATNQELEKAYSEISKKTEEFKMLLLHMSERLAAVAEGYDENTGQHIYRVKKLSGLIAENLNLEPDVVEAIKMFASLHDIGKIFIPKEILLKPGKLTPEEWEIMKKHTEFAKRILDVPGFERALSIALYHHENYDGSGYPFGLKGAEIPIEAQIVKIVDVYDALRSDRPYKRGYTHEEAMKIILEGDGRTLPQHFAPEVLQVFRELSEVINEAWESVR
ncbi:HD-GYP domain-containing protein [Fervidobacterium thailandense]|nr:HD domain-containing phosphohydrolase [Fervidobacterium thailandense]